MILGNDTISAPVVQLRIISNETLDADLMRLGAELAALDARYNTECINWEKDVYARHWSIREQIERTPAHTSAGLKVKVQAAEIALRRDPSHECDAAGSFVTLAHSIMRQIQAI